MRSTHIQHMLSGGGDASEQLMIVDDITVMRFQTEKHEDDKGARKMYQSTLLQDPQMHKSLLHLQGDALEKFLAESC